MQRWVVVMMVAVLGCTSYRHAELPRDSVGKACADQCVQAYEKKAGGNPEVVSCVSKCPGAVAADGECDTPRHWLCVQNEDFDPTSTLLVVGVGLALVLIVGAFVAESVIYGSGPD